MVITFAALNADSSSEQTCNEWKSVCSSWKWRYCINSQIPAVVVNTRILFISCVVDVISWVDGQVLLECGYRHDNRFGARDVVDCLDMDCQPVIDESNDESDQIDL